MFKLFDSALFDFRVDVGDKRISNLETEVDVLQERLQNDEPSRLIHKRHPEVIPLNMPIENRVNAIEEKISEIDRKVHEKTEQLERMTRNHQGEYYILT